MKIISIDTETTHVDKNTAQVLELGITLYDTTGYNTIHDLVENMPKLTIYIYRPDLSGSFSTLAFNADLIKEINQTICDLANKPDTLYFTLYSPIIKENYFGTLHHLVICTPEQVVKEFYRFLMQYEFAEYTSAFNANALGDIEKYKYMFKSMYFSGKNIATFDMPILNRDIPFWNEAVKMKHRQIDPSIVFTTSLDSQIPDLGTCFKRLGADKHSVSHRAVNDCIDVCMLLHFHFKKSLEKFRTFAVFNSEGKFVKTILEEELHDYQGDVYTTVLELNEVAKGAALGRIESFKQDCLNSSLYSYYKESEKEEKSEIIHTNISPVKPKTTKAKPKDVSEDESISII